MQIFMLKIVLGIKKINAHEDELNTLMERG